MVTINSCDELLHHLFEVYGTCEYCVPGHIEFQDEVCEIGGTIPDTNGIFMPSGTFHKTIFIMEQVYDYEKFFHLWIIMGDEFILDQTLGIRLPSYVRDELIATIKGEY